MMVSSLPAGATIAAVCRAAELWTDGSLPGRARLREAVAARTAYSLPVVDEALDRLFRAITDGAVAGVIAAELGSLEVLDGFVGDPVRGRVRALPLERVCIISSRTTIGVALYPAIFALCAGCRVLVKDRDDHLVAAFFDTLAQLEPAIAGRARAEIWEGEGGAVDLTSFDAVVAFGNDATLDRIAAQLPFRTRFIGHPTKVSAGYLCGPALADSTAARRVATDAALDALLYDGEGCLSLRVLFVEPSGAISPAAFCVLLAEAMREAAQRFPPNASSGVAARLALTRDDAVLRSDASHAVFADDEAAFLIELDAPAELPPLFLPRALSVRSVENPAQAAAYLAAHRVPIEALAVGSRERAPAGLAESIGASRITAFGALQAPPLRAFHGGRPRIAEFVRWIVDET